MQHDHEVEILQIFVAEDDSQIRSDLRRCIQGRDGLKLTEISTPEETVGMVRKKRPDLIVMDAAFGGASGGPKVAETIWSTDQIPVVFIADRTEQAFITDLNQDHVLGCLPKPFEDKDVDCIIASLRYINRLTRKNKREELSTAIPNSYLWRLRRLGYEMAIIEERSRRRIAFELHNNVGQCLSLLKMKIKQVVGSDIKSDQPYDDLLDLIDQIDLDTQYLISELSPPILYDLGLKTAIKWLTDQISENHGLDIKITDYTSSDYCHDRNSIILFRSIRELLENVVKHAQANEVNICLYIESGYQVISVEDNGVGFMVREQQAMNGDQDALGLFCIQEILFYLGGHVNIETSPGNGTKVSIFIPLEQNRMVQSMS